MKNIYLHSLGCPKNMVDSENMLGLLEQNNYNITDLANEADYIIINTCSFINDAKEESIEAILSAGEIKNSSHAKIIVTGCLPQRYRNELAELLPEIDILVGTTGFEQIVEIINEYEANSNNIYIEDPSTKIKENLPRKKLTPQHYSFLKIAEGCSNHCTYCIIPKIRGNYRSRRIEDIVNEANKLALSGVKEIILIAQDTSKYGIDLYGEKKLHYLISRISQIENIKWIRIHYLYPENIYEELISEFKTNSKLLNYFDLPIQHISNRILKKMNRKTSKENIENLIREIRLKIPSPIIRTSLITGFPGELEKDYEEMKEFLVNFELDKVGVFKYSREEGTPAYKMQNQINEEIKEARQSNLLQLQQEISFNKYKNYIDKIFNVIIDEQTDTNQFIGRTFMDSPEIDGYVFIESNEHLKIGEYYNVKIIDSLEYDLVGEVINLN